MLERVFGVVTRRVAILRETRISRCLKSISPHCRARSSPSTSRASNLLRLAELFEAENQGELVAELIRERSEASQEERLVEWLKQWAIKKGDIQEGLRLSEQLFWAHPSIAGYEETKSLAQQLGRWGEMRPQLMNRLEGGRQSALLTEIHLLEDEIDTALKTLRHSSAGPRGWDGSLLSIRVVRAAEKSRPHEAITLYIEAADRIIKARDRKSYAQAVGYLSRVRELYRGLGEEKTWQSFITDLKDKNRRLSALKEELNRAGM